MNGRQDAGGGGHAVQGLAVVGLPHRGEGRIEGDLDRPALSVSASGAVHGKVKVGDIKSEGELAGEFDAEPCSSRAP